jgi:hypothetical protein
LALLFAEAKHDYYPPFKDCASLRQVQVPFG